VERRDPARQRQPAGRRLYFTPVLSSALAAALLSAALSWSFWQGAGMVCAGSLLCWQATRR
jgi:drug/metabolite transporter (DMT)-like permease